MHVKFEKPESFEGNNWLDFYSESGGGCGDSCGMNW